MCLILRILAREGRGRGLMWQWSAGLAGDHGGDGRAYVVAGFSRGDTLGCGEGRISGREACRDVGRAGSATGRAGSVVGRHAGVRGGLDPWWRGALGCGEGRISSGRCTGVWGEQDRRQGGVPGCGEGRIGGGGLDRQWGGTLRCREGRISSGKGWPSRGAVR